MGHGDSRPISPAMMPKRQPQIPIRKTIPMPSRFQVSDQIPRRGWPDAAVWPDTGVLLCIGTDPALPPRFRSLYMARARLARGVDKEIRGQSYRSAKNPQEDSQKKSASVAVQSLLIASPAMQVVDPTNEDLPTIEQIKTQLRKVPGARDEKGAHTGEAAIIALALRAAKGGQRQVIFSNDGGASIVAHSHGIPTRHIGDVLGELACADHELDAVTALATFETAIALSAPPKSCRPAGSSYFNCERAERTCTTCDEADVTTTNT